eukprot:Sdes_comp19166_c0_seq2m9940
MMAMKGSRCAIYGGKGALGSSLVTYFKNLKWEVVSIDLSPNELASKCIVVNPELSLTSQSSHIEAELKAHLGSQKLDAIFCVAGGWAGGNASADDCVKNTELMLKQSVWTSIISARLAALFLKEGGLLQLTGAEPALSSTPGMIGYGLAKAAVHQLTASLASPTGGLPKNASVVCILPVTLDTPMNRKFMPSADFSTWTPLEFIGELFSAWCKKTDPKHPLPKSGSLAVLRTLGGVSSVTFKSHE